MAGRRVAENRHRTATRVNIPTAELESLADKQIGASPTLLYPRDPSLDPQLVWKGKDEEDRRDLLVPPLPIFIQEQISPRAIIEDLRRHSDDALGPSLFADFDGLDFSQRVEFYQHDRTWTNRLVLGDSLLVMASLAEKEGLKGKVQMIYMDPPYGIKFRSNWQASTKTREVKDDAGSLTAQPEQIRAFRDTWELGISSYLSYLRDRFRVAYDLLTESGSVFVQIGDDNVHLVRCVLDEIFGSNNYVAEICLKKPGQRASGTIPILTDFILWYARNKDSVKYRPLYQRRDLTGAGGDHYSQAELPDGTVRPLTDAERTNPNLLPRGARIFQTISLTSGGSQSGDNTYTFDGKPYKAPAHKHWTVAMPEGLDRLTWAGRIVASEKNLRFKNYFDDFPYSPRDNRWDDAGLFGESLYVVQTSTRAIRDCILMSTDPGDLVLDPTCGSGTTAFVAEQWGRRWITIDTSRVALAITRIRLMSAIYPYYSLADSPGSSNGPVVGDVSKGFVYEKVRRVTRESISKNPDLRPNMTRDEIEAAILRHAEAELLYDVPYVDKNVVRVTGPFTVESLSPHRVLPTADLGEAAPRAPADGDERFVSRILDNLHKAGVQNTVKNERLKFELIERWPGAYIQAIGEYLEAGKTMRAGICIGPEYGTVSPELVREAAKEASKICDLLVVCGFAFEAMVGEEATKLGRLQILRAKMSPDLSMGDELLKKTGSGNLFMVFGEPDIAITSQSEGEYVAEIRGLDIFDPTTGAVKSHDVDDIACWLIDTDYDEESFFAKHAYFLGGGDPYEKLRKALRAEIDEDAWATLYRTASRSFKKPTTGKIAIKVINHYGDEVLKVYKID